MFARLPYCVNADTRHPKRGRLLFAPLLGQMSCFHVSQVKYSTFNMLGKILAIQGGCKKCFAAPKKLFRPPLTSLRSLDRRQPFQNTKDFALHFSNENSSHSVDWKNLRNDLQRASTCPVHFSCDNFAIQRLSSRCFFSNDGNPKLPTLHIGHVEVPPSGFGIETKESLLFQEPVADSKRAKDSPRRCDSLDSYWESCDRSR